MQANHYTGQKHFLVYALVLPDETLVYIGKTAGKRLSAAYSQHIRGKIAATRDYFSKEEGCRPDLHLLEVIDTTAALAYRHVLCWIHRFQEADFQPLNHEGSLTQAARLLPETQRILDSFPHEEIQVLLSRTKLDRITAADAKSVSPPSHASRCVTQLSLRLTETEKTAFTSFAKKMHCNQREAFLYFMEAAFEKQGDLLQVSHRSKKTIDALSKENEKLRRQNQRLRNHTSPEFQQIDNLRKQQALCKQGILDYFQNYVPNSSGASLLPTEIYRKFMRSVPPEKAYQYPPEVGFLEFFPEAILCGKHPVLFLVGTDPEGNRFKFRVYSKKTNIGLSLQSIYGTVGSHWYLGFQKSKDGAMDLTFALPILHIDPGASATPKRNYVPLDDQIAAASGGFL